MNKTFQNLTIVAAPVLCTVVFESLPVQAAAFSFFLSETEPESLSVNGGFEGDDLNADGLITQNELTSYQANFGGSTAPTISPFTHVFADLESFTFSLDDFTNFNFRSSSIVDSQRVILTQTTSPDGNEFISGPGVAVGIEGEGGIGTSELLTVVESPRSVPEPSAIFGLGTVAVSGFGVFLKKRLIRN